MRICGIKRDNTACHAYRIGSPLYKLEELSLADVRFIYDGPELGTQEALDILLGSDMVVFHRPHTKEWFKFMKAAQENGKIIVADYDDDPFNTSPLNPYYKYVGIQEVEYPWADGHKQMLWKDGEEGFDIETNIRRRDLFRACFKRADMVTVTTDILAEKFKEINENTVVLPNLVDLDEYPKIDCVKKEIRIGWQGGFSHYEDLYMVKDALIKLLKENSNVTLVYFGDLRFAGLFSEAPKGQIEFHNWVPHVAYSYKLATLNLDIGICPLVDNEFNRNKSGIKYFEYSAVGAATLASNIPPYSEVIKDGITGLLVNPNGWHGALEEMIKDRRLIKSLADDAYDDVLVNHSLNRNAHKYYDAYKKLLEKEVSV